MRAYDARIEGASAQARPAISVACIEGEDLAVFIHGRVEILTEDHPSFDETLEHWTWHYGSSPLWGGRHDPHAGRARRGWSATRVIAASCWQRVVCQRPSDRTSPEPTVAPRSRVTHDQRRPAWRKRLRQPPACSSDGSNVET